MLLVTPGREAAIGNIMKAVSEGRFNDKTEPFDPEWEREPLKAEILRYVDRLDSPAFKLKNRVARIIVDIWRRKWSDGINEIRGMEKLRGVNGPAFITCNHFNPFDNGILRRMALDAGRGRLWAVSEGTNFVMGGLQGFVLRNIDVIPIINEPSYMNGKFCELLQRQLDRNRFILIYPEQEMWFNYRKPRPGKRGAFLFAARFNVPVIPCFIEMQELPRMVTPQFHNVKLILHILDPIYPDPALSPRENSFRMCEQDYEEKKQAYQRSYGKPLTYDFEPWDIAGWESRA